MGISKRESCPERGIDVSVGAKPQENHDINWVNWALVPEVYWNPPAEAEGAGLDSTELVFSLAKNQVEKTAWMHVGL